MRGNQRVSITQWDDGTWSADNPTGDLSFNRVYRKTLAALLVALNQKATQKRLDIKP